MATFASGSIHFSGLGSDTDFDTMINSLYQVESLHAQQLLKWKKDWSARLEAFGDLRTSLVTMQTELKKLSGIGSFLAKTYTSTRPEVSSATIGPDAEARDYSLNVSQIATSSIASCETTLQEKNTAISTTNGTLSIAMGSKTIEVNITGGSTSLEGLVKLINNHPDNTEKGSSGTTQPLVKASLVKSNAGYIIQIRSFETGADRVFSVDSTGANNMPQGIWGDTGVTNSSYSAGKDAKFFVDGIGTEIISSSNTVTDVVEGLTFNLRSVGETTITVSNDIDKIKENITKFVDTVNAVRSKLNELTAYNTEKMVMDPEIAETQNEMQKGSILTGNYGVQLIASQLKSICGSGAKGFEYFNAATNSGDIFSALSQIGITTDANQGSDTYGLLVINDVPSDKSAYGTLSLDEALAKDLAGIGRLFAAKNEVVVSGSSAFGFESFTFTESIRPGSYDVSYTIASDGSCTGATIGGYPATYNPVERTLLVTSPKDSPVYGLQLSLYDLSAQTHTGKVHVRQGKIDELLTALEAPGSERTGILEKGYQLKEEKVYDNGYKETVYSIIDRGSLAILEENYKTIMANIDKKVLKENTRLETWERRMRNKFARLEATLARYNAINDSMASQIKSLSTSSSNK